mgnify:CR=1 FL=1
MGENFEAWEMFQDYLVFGAKVLEFPWFRSRPEEEQYLLKEKLKVILRKLQEISPRGEQ